MRYRRLTIAGRTLSPVQATRQRAGAPGQRPPEAPLLQPRLLAVTVTVTVVVFPETPALLGPPAGFGLADGLRLGIGLWGDEASQGGHSQILPNFFPLPHL